MYKAYNYIRTCIPIAVNFTIHCQCMSVYVHIRSYKHIIIYSSRAGRQLRGRICRVVPSVGGLKLR